MFGPLIFLFYDLLIRHIIIEEMSDLYKMQGFDEKMVETADDFYTSNKPDSRNTVLCSLLASLNSKRCLLKSIDIEKGSYQQRLNELELEVEKLTISNQFLASQADSLIAKNSQILQGKSDLMNELKEWKDTLNCLKNQVQKSDLEFKERKSYILSLMEREGELRRMIKSKECQNRSIEEYNVELESQFQRVGCQLTKMKESRDGLAKMMTTLETFSKAFRKNIMQKQKQLSRVNFETSELEAFIATKCFEKSNMVKEIEKSEWQAKMYVHHNSEIERTNAKLKFDLEKLMGHLQSLKKNNKFVGGCIKEYSETGVKAAKKILTQANK